MNQRFQLTYLLINPHHQDIGLNCLQDNSLRTMNCVILVHFADQFLLNHKPGGKNQGIVPCLDMTFGTNHGIRQ